MRIAIMHLSDIHLQRDQCIDKSLIHALANAAVASLHSKDQLFVIAITGDLTNSGSLEEAVVADGFLRQIKESFHDRGVTPTVAFVPGNHDIELSEDHTYKQLCETIKRIGCEKAFEKDLDHMEPILLLANDYGWFIRERSADAKELAIDNERANLELALLNTAPFSTRTSDDKQLHFATEEMLKVVEKTADRNVKIILMHHSPHWFEDDSKRFLERALLSHCDLLLVGHEHDSYAEDLKTSRSKQIHILHGGTIDATGYGECTFNFYELDLQTHQLSELYFRWDRHESLFLKEHERYSKLETKCPGSLRPDTNFSSQIVDADDENGLPIKSIFTFPGVQTEIQADQDEIRQIDTMAELEDAVLQSRLVNLTGPTRSGKTTLLKMLYSWSLDAQLSPLYLDRSTNTPSLSKLIKDLVSDQYGESDLSRALFEQHDKKKRILFIDDFDKLKIKKKPHEYLADLLEHVERIVLTSCTSLEGSIIDQVKSSLGIEDRMHVFRIRSFFKTSRDELIEKVCRAKNANSDSESITMVIDRAVHGHQRLYRLNPDFIMQNIFYFVDKGTSKHAEDAPFNIIFEANIVNRLSSAYKKLRNQYFPDRSEESVIGQSMAILSEFAYRLHKSKSERTTSSSYQEIVDGYAREYGFEISSLSIFALCKKANLIDQQEPNSMVGFSSSNYHAYFVARRLSTLSSQGAHIDDDLHYLIENVCFDINENILLFLTYIREDVSFTLKLLEALENALGEEEPLSLDKGNIKFMALGVNPEIPMADQQAKKNRDQAIVKREEAIERDILEYRDLYDYDEQSNDTGINRFARSLKYLEMIGKTLISQFPIMKKEDKERIADAVYLRPNQILLEMLRPVDEDFDLIVDAIFQQFQTFEQGNHYTREDIREVFVKIGISMCLGTYDTIAFSCANRDTIRLMETKRPDSTNGRIQYLLMADSALKSTEFLSLAITYYEKARKSHNILEMISVRAIVNKHLMDHKNIPHHELQRVGDVIFSGKGKIERLRDNRA